jgi:hypothetical protein
MDRVTRLIEAIKKLIEGEFTGYVKINFTQGSLGRIEKFEELDDVAILAAGDVMEGKRGGETFRS